MRTVFADSFYFIAQLNPADEAYGKATTFTASYEGRLITTEWVLAEVGDAFSRPPNRERFVQFYQQLLDMPDLAIIPATFADGFELFMNRPDKEWSLTDCISFVVMTKEGVTEALTGDHHFEQANFVALLKAGTPEVGPH
jgi:predicted nucleic acid-binding protein